MASKINEDLEDLYITEDRLEAVRELARLQLPVGDPEEMEVESVPSPEDLMPS